MVSRCADSRPFLGLHESEVRSSPEAVSLQLAYRPYLWLGWMMLLSIPAVVGLSHLDGGGGAVRITFLCCWIHCLLGYEQPDRQATVCLFQPCSVCGTGAPRGVVMSFHTVNKFEFAQPLSLATFSCSTFKMPKSPSEPITSTYPWRESLRGLNTMTSELQHCRLDGKQW